MNIYEYLQNNKYVDKIIKSDKIIIGKTSDGFNQAAIISDFYSSNKSIFVVLPNLFTAQKYYDSLVNYTNPDNVLFFPADELVSTQMISSSGDFLYERIETLYTLLTSSKKIIITNIHGIIKYEMNKDKWLNSYLVINNNTRNDISKMVEDLVSIGYSKVFTVTKTGEFSRRGSILDIFPLGYENPIRLDFFDDYIDTMKEFDVDTQRSISKINNITVLPVSEFIYNDEDLKRGINNLNNYTSLFKLSELESDMYKRDIENLYLHNNLDILSRYLTFFDDKKSTILDFVCDKRIYLIDIYSINLGYEKLKEDLIDTSNGLLGKSLENMDIFSDIAQVINNCNVITEGLVDLENKDIDIYSTNIEPYKANKKLIIDDFSDLVNKKKLIVSILNKDRLNNLKELLKDNNVTYATINDCQKINIGQVNFINEATPDFDLDLDDILLINEAKIFDIEYRKPKPKYKSLYKNAQKISKYDELILGDYVVHYDYGIGKYNGIKTLELGGIKRDVIEIIYGNNSKLSIPLEQINSLMKYASYDALNVTINNIGDGSWSRAKARVRKKVHDISEKLISLYARRNKSIGFKYPEDSALQIEFENDFEYDLTEGQKLAIMDVKHDMESVKPMDRLICGDVGYGKTEVALRAAFKAILAGKQVAVLAPTTILARQHYLNFKNRMEKYGASVKMLSRFVTKKEQTKVLENLKLGSVDCVIGTHRLLSNDVEFHDLGLLVVDEEQRFGVTHKEKIKELKVNVDCITLSATPIPRTLQMSILGIKDLSMIETPPKNRYPVQTYVVERNDKIIASSIERELSRGGQVFYLYNYVSDIEDVKHHLESLCPYAKIAVAHGQLPKDKFEDIILDFTEGKYDVLLCTTIVEIGIDMPNTNTLIIHDADRLGLAQMYQIRGRVGRSNKIAYAYLMYEPRKILTKESVSRLETIKEFNELGSGYKIAMRDLSIRGSGDLLGDEQSGFVETIGIDTYLKILDEEINILNKKDLDKKEENKTHLQTIMVNRTISPEYISNDDTRILIHKRIDKLNNINEMNDLILELEDRFGKPDVELILYMKEKILKKSASNLGIDNIIRVNSKEFKLELSEEETKNQDGIFIFSILKKYPHIKMVLSDGKLVIQIKALKDNLSDVFDEAISFMSVLYEHNLNII